MIMDVGAATAKAVIFYAIVPEHIPTPYIAKNDRI